MIAGCGDDGGETRIDASVSNGMDDAKPIDAPPDAQAFVLTVPCEGDEVDIVTTEGFKYQPMNTEISVDGVVKFVMSPGSGHNVLPQPGGDPGLVVPFGETRCLQFTMAGTFGFRCGPHGFIGTVIVN